MNSSVITGLTILMGLVLFVVGVVVSWLAKDIYYQWLELTTHPFIGLIEESPHPECFDDEGNPILGEYIVLDFSGYDEDGNWEEIFEDED